MLRLAARVIGAALLATGPAIAQTAPGLAPYVFEQGFPGLAAEQLVEPHAQALRFLADHGIDAVPIDPSAWFDLYAREYDDDRAAVRAMSQPRRLGLALRTMLKRTSGMGPLANQRGIEERLARPPFQ